MDLIPVSKSAAEKRAATLQKYLEFAENTGRFYIHPSSQPGEKSLPRWGVTKVKSKTKRKVLITGTGRCGTDYISRLFVENGYDVPHERVGEYGSSSHWFITDSDWYPVLTFTPGLKAHVGQRKDDFIFEKTIHLIREPLVTIKSITNIFRSDDYEFLEANNIVPPGINLKSKKRFYRGMLIYYYVNKFIRDTYPESLLVHIEKIETEINSISEFLNIPKLNITSLKATNTSKRILGFRLSKDEVTFATLKAIDYSLAEKIWHLSKSLGYSL